MGKVGDTEHRGRFAFGAGTQDNNDPGTYAFGTGAQDNNDPGTYAFGAGKVDVEQFTDQGSFNAKVVNEKNMSLQQSALAPIRKMSRLAPAELQEIARKLSTKVAPCNTELSIAAEAIEARRTSASANGMAEGKRTLSFAEKRVRKASETITAVPEKVQSIRLRLGGNVKIGPTMTTADIKQKLDKIRKSDKKREDTNLTNSKRSGVESESCIHYILRRIKETSDCMIFKPENPIRMSWDIAMMCLILYYAFAVPLRLGFGEEPKYPNLEHFFTGCFALDMLINFNTALIGQGGILVFDRSVIAADYFKMWFWIDFVATFPFEIVTGGDAAGGDGAGDGGAGAQAAKAGKLGRLGKMFRLLRIFKLLRILKLGRILKRLKHSSNINPNWYMLMKTMAVMGFSIHVTACGYWAVATNQPDDEFGRTDEGQEQWMPPDFIKEADFNAKYAYAFFWGISVTTGVGWDVIPATEVEVAFSAIMILCGMALYISILGSITSIFANFNQAKALKMVRTAPHNRAPRSR
jgi:hypothetical protein